MQTTKGGFYITQIKQLQDRIFERLLVENGLDISGGQGRILFVLWQEECLTVSDISIRTSLAKNTVSIILDGMATKGMVTRENNPDNRRQTLITLTPKAKAMRAQYEKVSEEMSNLFYQGFSDEEISLFENDLARILHTLTETEQTMRNRRYHHDITSH